MDRSFLEGLGLEIREDAGVVEALLELTSGRAINPMTRRPIDVVTFTSVGSRLLYVGPEEFIGSQPIYLAHLPANTKLEDLVIDTLNAHLYQLERRSAELSAIGLAPRVDPVTLQLTAEVNREPFRFVIGASRAGEFRIAKAVCRDMELTSGGVISFELSEFRDRRALEQYLFALFADVADVTEPPEGPVAAPRITTFADATEPSAVSAPHSVEPHRAPLTPSTASGVSAGASVAPLTVSDFFGAFGDATIPGRTSIEVLCELRANDQLYRFAAARVEGTTFRGLLAGPNGKVWAERFEVDQFPGIRALVAELLKIDIQDIEVV